MMVGGTVDKRKRSPGERATVRLISSDLRWPARKRIHIQAGPDMNHESYSKLSFHSRAQAPSREGIHKVVAQVSFHDTHNWNL